MIVALVARVRGKQQRVDCLADRLGAFAREPVLVGEPRFKLGTGRGARFAAAGDSQQVRVYWVQVGPQRIPVDAVI